MNSNANHIKQNERNKHEQNRSKLIRDYCAERHITKLCHFTRIENLKSILHLGLLGRTLLQEVSKIQQTQQSIFNDDYRLDGHTEAVCLSISFPNYKMFYKLNHSNPKEWVVLLIEPYLLWEFDCAFYGENAASNAVKHISLSERKCFSSFAQMFMDYNNHKRQDIGISSNCPTHPQAEVLILEPISPKYIMEVHFNDKEVTQKWLTENKGKFTQKFTYGSQYFMPREDWAAWKSNNN